MGCQNKLYITTAPFIFSCCPTITAAALPVVECFETEECESSAAFLQVLKKLESSSGDGHKAYFTRSEAQDRLKWGLCMRLISVGLFGLIETGISVKEKSKGLLAAPGVLLPGT